MNLRDQPLRMLKGIGEKTELLFAKAGKICFIIIRGNMTVTKNLFPQGKQCRIKKMP